MKAAIQSSFLFIVMIFSMLANAHAEYNGPLVLEVKYGAQSQDQFAGDKTCLGAVKSIMANLRQLRPEGYQLNCWVSSNGTARCPGFDLGALDPNSQEYRFYYQVEGPLFGGDANPTVLHMISGKIGSNDGFYEVRRINSELAARELYRVGPDAFRIFNVSPICFGRMRVAL